MTTLTSRLDFFLEEHQEHLSGDAEGIQKLVSEYAAVYNCTAVLVQAAGPNGDPEVDFTGSPFDIGRLHMAYTGGNVEHAGDLQAEAYAFSQH